LQLKTHFLRSKRGSWFGAIIIHLQPFGNYPSYARQNHPTREARPTDELLPIPEYYDGNPLKLNDWLFQLKNYFELVNVNPERRIATHLVEKPACHKLDLQVSKCSRN
jgi:hypothetical protein